MHIPRIVSVAPLACLMSMAIHAAPYVPTDGAQVLERLPSQSNPALTDIRRLRAAFAASPDDPRLAAMLARRYIEASRGTGDPRYLGYAQAVLARWWDLPDAPVALQLLRATILQSQHQFSQALADLDAVLDADPGNAQAWLTRATILQVQGHYAQARKSCVQLQRRATRLAVITCMAGVDSLDGQGDRSDAVLDRALKENPDADAALRIWAMTLLAEIAERQGRLADAERRYRRALALDPADTYLLGAYADFLLDRNRAAEVVSLLQKSTRIDSLLLRYALALKRQNSPEAARHIDALQSRFAAAMLRGDTVHRREQARFELQLNGDPVAALELARKNWDVQKEPADARVFLEAAIANDAKAEAKPVLAWLKQSGLKNRTMLDLAAKLDGAR